MALNRAVEINHGRGLSGTPLLGQSFSADAKASCIASSARSKSLSRRIRVARIRRESTRYRESSNSRICSGERSDMTATLATLKNQVLVFNSPLGQDAVLIGVLHRALREGLNDFRGVEHAVTDGVVDLVQHDHVPVAGEDGLTCLFPRLFDHA